MTPIQQDAERRAARKSMTPGEFIEWEAAQTENVDAKKLKGLQRSLKQLFEEVRDEIRREEEGVNDTWLIVGRDPGSVQEQTENAIKVLKRYTREFEKFKSRLK